MKSLMLFLMIVLSFSFSTFAQERGIVAILESQFPGVTVRIDPVRGILIINATPEEHEKIEMVLNKLDVPVPQISIETRFIELSVTELGETVVDLDALRITVDGEVIQVLSPWLPGPPLSPGDPGILRHPEAPAIEFLDPGMLTVALRALEGEGKAELISAPRVTTLNNQEATIDLMVSVPYVGDVVSTNMGTSEFPIWVHTYRFAEEEKGVRLKVTPSVTPGETLITLYVEPTVRMLEKRLGLFKGVGNELDWPVMGGRTATTQMIVESGKTVVLGGMIDSRKEVSKGRVPLLGSIPILGHFFRFRHYEDRRKKLLIFLTPYILCPAGEKIVTAQ